MKNWKKNFKEFLKRLQLRGKCLISGHDASSRWIESGFRLLRCPEDLDMYCKRCGKEEMMKGTIEKFIESFRKPIKK